MLNDTRESFRYLAIDTEVGTKAALGRRLRPGGCLGPTKTYSSHRAVQKKWRSECFLPLRMSNMSLRRMAGLIFLGAPSAFGQVAVNGVVSAASWASPVAAGSVVAIFGTQLASVTASSSGYPLPTNIQGTSVTVNGVSAPLYFVSSGQINAQMPSSILFSCDRRYFGEPDSDIAGWHKSLHAGFGDRFGSRCFHC